MRSIAIVNQKGGCGKTTTAVNLSSMLSDAGKRVLLIDSDPQSHASIGLGIETDHLERSTYDLLIDPAAAVGDVAVHVTDMLDVVPSSVVLSAVEQQLSGRPDRENKLRRKIEAVSDAYDYIFIDCPPSVGLLTFNAIVAAHEAIVVMEPSYFSLHGAMKIMETIDLVRGQLGMSKRVRVLLTMYDGRTKFAREFLREARARFGREMFENTIRSTVRFREAANWGVSISHYSRGCKGAHDYERFTREVLADGDALELSVLEPVEAADEQGLPPGMEDWILAQPGPHFIEGGVLFSLVAPEANEVELVGSFNNWDREHGIRLTRNSSGVWHTKLDLEPGRHLYKFIIDGAWCADPANENRSAPHEDCVLEVYRKE